MVLFSKHVHNNSVAGKAACLSGKKLKKPVELASLVFQQLRPCQQRENHSNGLMASYSLQPP